MLKRLKSLAQIGAKGYSSIYRPSGCCYPYSRRPKCSDHPPRPQARNRGVIEFQFAQNFVRMLAQQRRALP